ncbi:P-II family nitrogen regulator [Chrysiogenes arsenatis]|uniref:P-II family nitrogen regulator n=1 Tax=Chrysiogenes arsenatis TaxID=309797 RepID=UPI0003FD4DE6|nr:P-II family nitrogen regulator [Chrysiogenes arsenatis]
MENTHRPLKLVTTIVRVELSEAVIAAIGEIGVDGWSATRGRGTSQRSYAEFFGMRIEPMKEIIYTIVTADLALDVVAAVRIAAALDVPGNGVCFVTDIEHAVGV